jgi:hypothetical protein
VERSADRLTPASSRVSDFLLTLLTQRGLMPKAAEALSFFSMQELPPFLIFRRFKKSNLVRLNGFPADEQYELI